MQATAAPQESTEQRSARTALRTLTIRDFRNFERLDLVVPPEGAIIIGANGSGKSNLLEAVYYFEVFRSFRGARDGDLVRFGCDVFRLEAEVEGSGDTQVLTAAWQRTTKRKKVTRQGIEPERISDAIGGLNAVVMSLEDAELIWGSPSGRRRFLDVMLSVSRAGYLGALQRYRTGLAQRNEALRQGRAGEAEAWAEGLVVPGATLMAARSAWIADMTADFARYHAAVSGGADAELRYAPALSGLSVEAERSTVEWSAVLREAMDRGLETDLRRGATQAGPHRDDLVVRAAVDGEAELRDLRRYGSGGQRRTAAIALRMAEADTMRLTSGREPVFLLDDVFAELDPGRSRRVLELLEDGRAGQVILTAPKPVDLPLRGGSLERWRIDDGKVSALD